MKLSYYIISVFLILFSISENAFSQTTQEELLGNWILDYNISINHMEQKARSHYNNMKIKQKQRFDNINKNRQLHLNADNSFLLNLGTERDVSGIWELDVFNKKIILTSEKGNVQIYNIKTFSENTLIVKLNNTSSSNLMLEELYFNKH